MKNSVFRALCALVLVCVLLVGWSPIQVKANTLALAGTAILNFLEAGAAAAGMSVFSYVAIGLGLTFGAAKLVDVVGDYIEYSGELGAKIYYFPDGSWSYGVDMSFVESVRAFFFDTGVLSEPLSVLSDNDRAVYNAALADYLSTGYESCHVILAINSTATSSGYNKVSFGQYAPVLENGRYSAYDASGKRAYFVTYTLQGSNYVKTTGGTTPWPGAETYIFRSGCAVSTDLSIELGRVALPNVDLPTGYSEWYGNSRPYVTPGTEEEVAVLPIPYNPTADPEAAPGVLTQPDIWGGSIADPIPGIESGTDTTISVTPWETFKTWISTGWQSIIQVIPTAGTIADAIGNVITSIFVPTADFLQPKIEELKARFPFIDGVIGLGHFVRDNLSSDLGPPVIYVDFGSATTDLFGHKKYLLTDFAWYAPYKPTVDALMSSILWAFFGWRVFVRLPSIISGEGGQVAFLALSDLRRREDEYMESEKQRARGDKE